MPISLGQTIERAKAEELFGNFIKIKHESGPLVLDVLNNSAWPDRLEKIRYYCGQDLAHPERNDIAYVFDRSSLDRIISIMDHNGGNGMVLFQGSRKASDSIDPSGHQTDVDGRPTIMLFACQYQIQTIGGVEKLKVINLLESGEEHPGSGGTYIDSADPKLPDEFTEGEINPFFL